MLSTPLINPNRSIDYQLLISLVILCALDKSPTYKKKVLSFERFVLYHYLINNPATLNKVLSILGKKKMLLLDYEKTRLSLQSTTKLFDDVKLRVVLQLLSTNNLLATEYSGDLGILYIATPKARKVLDLIDTKYLIRLQQRAVSMRSLQSSKVFKIKTIISQIIGENHHG